MPFTLSTLVSVRAHRFHSSSPTSSSSKRKLYFPPGGHTHDRHTIPPDRLHISLSDPVLVAAERRLFDVPNTQKLLIIEDAAARKTAKLGSVVFHLKQDGLPSQMSADCHVAPEAVNRLATIPNTQGTTQGHCWKTGYQGAAGNTDIVASKNSRDGSSLAPLASETFKEELYARGYLKRPASRPSNVVPRKSRTSFMFVSRRVFPGVLGRRQGRKVVECLRAGQDIAGTPGGLDVQFGEKQFSTSVASVTLRTPYTGGFESPGLDTNSSASDSFDLHEFSYLTAFTTPPSSPSIILDAETFKKGVDSKHAV